MNKINDWFAANLNCPDFTMDQMAKAGVTPDNTTLQSKDYYKTVPQVKAQFTDTSTGKFDDEKFDAYYDALSRSYNDFAETDFVDHWLESIESSPYDIFSTGQPSFDATVKMIRNKDSQRHSVGISGMGRTGDPVFDEREVAQANFVRDENGNKLDYTPNQKWALGTLFSKDTYVMAQYDEDGYYNENGTQVFHRKGERKYDENGDPYYEILGKRSVLGRDVLHVSDVVTRDDSWINKLDFFDSDSLETSVGKTIFKTLSQVALFAVPHVGPYMGAVKAVLDFGSVMPKLGKSLDGLFTGDATDGSFGSAMEQLDAVMSRFDKSTTQYAKEHQWAFENIGDMIGSSAGQLYSQRCIAQIPKLFSTSKNITKLPKLSSALSVGYMALTSAEETYNTFKQAGASDRMAGIGFLLTSAAYYKLMDNDYYKQWLFKNTDLVNDPEMQYTIRGIAKTAAEQLNKDVKGVATTEATKKAEMGIAKNLWKKLKDLNSKVPKGNAYPTTGEKVNLTLHAYANHAMNEGLEEFMEEGVIDIVKGISEGAEALGLKVTDDKHEKLAFGWDISEMLNRYVSSFVGGAVGGAVFEGLTRWENYWRRGYGAVDSFSDYSLDRKFRWYILNGYEQDLRKAIEYERRKGSLGNRNLTWNGHVTKGVNGKSEWVFDSVTDENHRDNQNDQMANMLNDKIVAIKAQMQQLGLLEFDYDNIKQHDAFVGLAEKHMEEEAQKEGITVAQYKKKHGWSNLERIINDTKIDDAIFSDVSLLQNIIMTNQEQIDSIRESYIRDHNISDQNVAQVDEWMDKNETVKLLKKEQDTAKKTYKELLEGKHAGEYWGLAVFAHNNLYRSMYGNKPIWNEKDSDAMKRDVHFFARAKYDLDYDSLNDKTKEYISSDYSQFITRDSTDEKAFRVAYNIYRRMLDRFDPLVKKAMENMTHESGHTIIDSAMEDKTFYEYYKELKMQIDELKPKRDALILKQSTSQLTEEEIEYLDTLTKTIRNLEIDYNGLSEFVKKSDPMILNRVFDGVSEDSPIKLDILSGQEVSASAMLTSLKNYFNYLVANKLILAYNNPLYDGVIGSIFEDFRDAYKKSVAKWRELDSQYEEKRQAIAYIKNAYIDEDGSVKTYEIEPIEGEDLMLKSFEDASEFEKYMKDLFGEAILPFVHSNLASKSFEIRDDQGNLIGINKAQQSYNNTWGALVSADQIIHNSEDFEEAWAQRMADVEIDLHFRDNTGQFFHKSSRKGRDLDALIDTIVEKAKQGEDWMPYVQQAKELAYGSTNTPYMHSLIDPLFTVIERIQPDVQEIKALKEQVRPSPITDILENISMMVGDEHMPVLDFLKAEIQRNASPAILDEYVMNENSYKQLSHISTYLKAVDIMLAGMTERGFNGELNVGLSLEENSEQEPYAVLDDQQHLFLLSEMRYVQSRIRTLLEISDLHTKSLPDKQMEVAVNMRPKYIQKLIASNVDIPEHEGVTLDSLWRQAIVDTSINELASNVNKENYEEFNSVVWKFEQLVWETLKDCDAPIKNDFFKKLFPEILNVGGIYDEHPDTNVTDMGAALYFLRIAALDPTEYRQFYKGLLNRNGNYPFDGQEMVIGMAVGALLNQSMYSELVANIVAKRELTDPQGYVGSMSRLTNLLAILGNTGVGKSKIIVKNAIDLVKAWATKNGQTVDVLATTSYQGRLDEMKNELGLEQSQTVLSKTLITEIAGHEIGPDDYVDVLRTGHPCKATEKTLSEITSEKLKERFKNPNSNIRIVVLDEGTFQSEAELQILCEAAKQQNIFIFLTGDLNQQYAWREYDEIKRDTNGNVISKQRYKATSGLEDCTYGATPTLTVSMRASNEGMYNSILAFNRVISNSVKKLKEDPSIEYDKIIPKTEYIQINTQYHETADKFCGMKVVDDIRGYITKFDDWTKAEENKPRVAIITDKKDTYSALANDNVKIVSPEEVQGQEFDYVVVDVDTSDSIYDSKFTLVKAINTWLSRATNGAVIAKKSEFTDPNSFNIVSSDVTSAAQQIDLKNREDDINAYKDLIDNRYRDITAVSNGNPETNATGGSGTNGSTNGSTNGGTNGGTNRGSSGGTNPSRKANGPSVPYQEVTPTMPSQDALNEAIENAKNRDDSGSIYKDSTHYRNHMGKLKDDRTHFESDEHFSLEAFYNWLQTDEFEQLITNDYYANPFANIPKDTIQKVRKTVQTLVYAMFNGMSKNEDKSNNSIKAIIKTQLQNNPELDGISFKDPITDLDVFTSAIADNFNSTYFMFQPSKTSGYSVLWFFFEVGEHQFAIPIGTMFTAGSANPEPFTLTVSSDYNYALTPLSSRGDLRVPLTTYDDKVGSSQSGAIFRPAAKDGTTEITWTNEKQTGRLDNPNVKSSVKKFYNSKGRFYMLWSLNLNKSKEAQDLLFADFFSEVKERNKFINFTKTRGIGEDRRIDGTQRIIEFDEYLRIAATLQQAYESAGTDAELEKALQDLNVTIEDLNIILHNFTSSTNDEEARARKRKRHETLDKYTPINSAVRPRLFSAILRNACNDETSSDWTTLRSRFISNFLTRYFLGASSYDITESTSDPNAKPVIHTYSNGIVINAEFAGNVHKRMFVQNVTEKARSVDDQDYKSQIRVSILNDNGDVTTAFYMPVTTEELNALYDQNNFYYKKFFELLLKNESIKAFFGNPTIDALCDQFNANFVSLIPATLYTHKNTATPMKTQTFYLSDSDLAAMLLKDNSDFETANSSLFEILKNETVRKDIQNLQSHLKTDKVFKYGMYVSENEDEGQGTLNFGKKNISAVRGKYSCDIIDMVLPAYKVEQHAVSGDRAENALKLITMNDAEYEASQNKSVITIGDSNQYSISWNESGQNIRVTKVNDDTDLCLGAHKVGDNYYAVLIEKGKCHYVKLEDSTIKSWADLAILANGDIVWASDDLTLTISSGELYVAPIINSDSPLTEKAFVTAVRSKSRKVVITWGSKTIIAKLDLDTYTEVEKIFLKGCTVNKDTMRAIDDYTIFTPNCVISSAVYKKLTGKKDVPPDPIQIVEVNLSSNPFFKLADGTNVTVTNTTLFNSLFANGNEKYPSIHNILKLSEDLKQELDYRLHHLNDPMLTSLNVINKFLEENAWRIGNLYTLGVNGMLTVDNSNATKAKLFVIAQTKGKYRLSELSITGTGPYIITAKGGETFRIDGANSNWELLPDQEDVWEIIQNRINAMTNDNDKNIIQSYYNFRRDSTKVFDTWSLLMLNERESQDIITEIDKLC